MVGSYRCLATETMVIPIGTKCYFRLSEGGNGVLAEGWLVETGKEHTMIAVTSDAAARFGGLVMDNYGFLRIPTSALAATRPSGWRAEHLAPTTQFGSMLRTYMRSEDAIEETSAESVAPAASTAVANGPSPPTLEAGDAVVKAAMQRMFGGNRQASSEEDEEDEEDSEGSSDDGRGRSSSRRRRSERDLRPGEAAGSGARRRRDKKKDSRGFSLDQLPAEALSKLDPRDLVMLGIAQKLMDKGGKKERRRDRDASSSSSGGSDAARAGRGHRIGQAFLDLERIRKKIAKTPRKVTRRFERKIKRELGIVPGMPWRVVQWILAWRWGKHRTLMRCAVMDAAAYEHGARGDLDMCLAQLAQNMKCKQQAALAGGQWNPAWLLCGLEDPISVGKFAGDGDEMAVLGSYVAAESELAKKMTLGAGSANAWGNDAWAGYEEDPNAEDGGGGGSAARRKRWKKKNGSKKDQEKDE